MKTINLTSNLKLQKPTSDEKYNVQIQNTNMDILDTSVKALQDKDATLTKQTDFTLHTENKNNPHGVTKEQLGLSNLVNQRQIPAIQSTVIDGGVPVFDGNGYTLKDSGFTIGKSVPGNAEFTDTIYTHPESGVSEGSYKNVYVNEQGHVIGGVNPTTLDEYGITDAAPIDHSHTVEEIGADILGSADNALNQAKEYTDLKIAEQHGENVFKKQIVASLPTQNIDTNTIYLVLKPDANGNDNYNEYINLDGTSSGYEWIGNTFVDLTDYYNKTESNNLFMLKTNVVNNLTTTDGGKSLDARQGKILDARITSNSNSITDLNRNLTSNISTITSSWLGNSKISFDGANFWATASNGLKKKLGSGGLTIVSIYRSNDPSSSNSYRIPENTYYLIIGVRSSLDYGAVPDNALYVDNVKVLWDYNQSATTYDGSKFTGARVSYKIMELNAGNLVRTETNGGHYIFKL